MAKTTAMESGGLPPLNNLETAAILENLGSCCEGTVFTFTSAGSRWRLRQRLNRNKASLLGPHGGLLIREDPADSVFTEMRIMPRSGEPNSSDGVELWNRMKLNSTRAMESSRANNVACCDAGDLRNHDRVKKFTAQVAGDQRGKVSPQNAVKADHARKELQVSTEEPPPRRSRRYLRCDNFRERHKYGDVVEDGKTWIWNEKKLEEVHAHELSREASHKGNKPAEERRNKRESCAEEIHVFEQRKVKCRRREQDSCSTHSESVQSEDLFKAEDIKRASYGFNHRQGAPEEPRQQQAGPVAVISPSVADESTMKRRGSSSETAEETTEQCSNIIAKQKPVYQLHIQRGNVSEENISWMTPSPEMESASTPPIACSFISFKGGLSCVGNRRCRFPGNSSSRARRFPDVEHGATASSDGNEAPYQILRNTRLFRESSTHALSISPNRTQRIVELSLPRRNREVEEVDAQTKTGRAGRPEALDGMMKSTGRERIMLSESGVGNSSHIVGQEVPLLQKPMSKELSYSWSSRAVEGSLDIAGDTLSSWERSHSGISKPKHTSVKDGESETRRIDVSQLDPSRVKEEPLGRLSSSLLDWYGSLEFEDDLEPRDLDVNDQRSNARDSDHEFISEREADGPSPVHGRGESRDDIIDHSLGRINNFPSAEVTYSEPSGQNRYVDDGNADNRDKLRNEIDSNNLRKSKASELEKQSFREANTDVVDRKQSIERSCTSRSEKGTEIVDLDPLRQKSVPLRRQAWVKGFKKKTGEKVSYFESWLGRSKKLHKTSPGRKRDPKGVGELSQANQTVESKLVDKHDKSGPFGHSIDQHLVSQAWSKKESQAYVTKEFEILEAVLQSEVNMDGDESETDHVAHTGEKSRAVIDIFDRKKGRWQEGGTITGQSHSLELDAVSMNTVASSLETDNNLVHLRCTIGDGLPFKCGGLPEGENFQQLHLANMSRTCKNSAKLNTLGEQKSNLVGFWNNSDSEAEECRPKEDWEDRLASPHENSSVEGLNIISERHSLKLNDMQDCRVMSEKVVKTSLEKCRDKDIGMFPHIQDAPCCTRDAQGIRPAEKCGFLFEKESRNQANEVTGAHDKVVEGMQPFHRLRVLNDSRDLSTHKVLNDSDSADGEMNMADRFGGVATDISGLADQTSMSRMNSKQSCPSVVRSISGNRSEAVVDSREQIQILDNPVNRVSSAFSQQVSSPVQESSVPDILKHGKQAKSSSVKELQSASDVVDEDSNFTLESAAGTDVVQSSGRRVAILESKSSQVMVGSEDKAQSTDEHFFRLEATREFGDTESDTAVNTGLEYSSENVTSEIDFDHFPSSIKATTEKEMSGAEKKKDTSVNRRHKMPIIVRVRNRLANGWLLQHPLWKRVAKQKMKTGESQALATKGINQNETHADPSRLTSGQGSAGDSLTDLHESKTENAINRNPTSKQDSELTCTNMPQNLIFEALHQTCANENQVPLNVLDTSQYHPNTDDMENKSSASEKYAVVQQNEIYSKQAPSGNHDEVERDHLKKDECPGQESSVLSFAEWQSRATGFGKSSPSPKRVGENSVSAMKEPEREVTELGKSNELNDVGELLSVFCLGNSVKEATVLGTLSEFDARDAVSMILGQGKVEMNSGGFKQGSDDVCGAGIPAFCSSKEDNLPVVSQISTDCRADEHIFTSGSETTSSSYCQTEPVAEAKVPGKKQTHIPVNSPANLSSENCFPRVEEGAESELSQGRKSLQKYFSLNDQNDDLHSCSSASLDDVCEGSPSIPGTVHMPRHMGDSISEQPQLDGQRDTMCFIPQVEDILDYLSGERTVDQSVLTAPSQCQPCPGTADKEQHKSVPNHVEPCGEARVVTPFCPPFQVPDYRGKEMVPGNGPVKEKRKEDPRKYNCQVRGRQEEPEISCSSPANEAPGDLMQWEIMEMLKLPNNQQQVFSGHKPTDFLSKDNQEHICRTRNQTNSWESSCRRGCSGIHGTLCLKDVPDLQSPNDLPTEDEIFLERFSASSNNIKSWDLPQSGLPAYSKLGIESLRRPYSSSPDLTSQMKLLSAPGRLNCGRTGSLSFDRSVGPASLPSDVQLINSVPPCVSTRSSSGGAGRPDSNQEYKHERYNTFEPKSLPDYAASFDCPSPSSSLDRSLDNSEKHFTRARLCTHCLNKYEPQDTCVHCPEGMHDWKRSATAECFPSLTMHSTSFPAQCQSLLLNSRPNSCLSHSAQPSTKCRCDACNLSCRFSPPVVLSCHHPPCISVVQHHRQCHFPGHPRSVTAPSNELSKFQNSSAPSLHGQDVQCLQNETLPPYIPLRVMQPSGTYTPWSHGESQKTTSPHERYQFADKNRVTKDCQVEGPSKINQTKETEKGKGLVWLSPEEIDFIQQLRLSGEKATAICRHDAAACIQRNWRKYFEKKTKDLKVESEQLAAASSLLTEYPTLHGHFQYCKLRQLAISLHLCGSSPKELSQGNLVKRLYRTMQKAARIIQRAWRSVLKNRKEKVLARSEWPKDLKNFYDIVKSRHVARGRLAPSFELFAKSVERIQAATEGARVRRRLKSHRLQTIIMEIKEIRMLLFEMSQEENCNSTPFLFPQLCTQLRQKILQLRAALNGKQMEARFLLRRCPATPLTLHPSRSTSPKPIYLVPSQKSVDQALAKLSSGAGGARKYYTPPLTNPASVVTDSRIAHIVPLTILSPVPADQKLIHTRSFVPLVQGSNGNAIQLRNSSPDRPESEDTPDSAKLLQCYFLAQRNPSKRNAGQGTPTDSISGHEANVKKGVTEMLDPSKKKSDLSFSSQKASPKSTDPHYSLNKSFDEQPLPVPQRRKVPYMSFEEMVVGGSNASMYLTEYAPSTDSTDKPKRPFLKRKSIVMPSQKLDWSKVKPMVSSRLEPELKTKLSLCKGSTKEPTKSNSKKKANYSNVKSRLFSYEENVSPSNSADGTSLHLQSTETSEAGYPPMLRGGCRESRGSSSQGTENGRNSRTLSNRQRTASPDLMHLRRMAEADRHCSQTSMLETQSVATYSSHFNSARYLHKLGNSEETSKGTLVGSCQQRTQRIRLRIVPRSKESEVGDLFVQEETQEIWEDQSLSADGKGKRQQSHSHRYAIYQEQDARYASSAADTTRQDSAEEHRNVSARASRKETQEALRHEVYKYFETK